MVVNALKSLSISPSIFQANSYSWGFMDRETEIVIFNISGDLEQPNTTVFSRYCSNSQGGGRVSDSEFEPHPWENLSSILSRDLDQHMFLLSLRRALWKANTQQIIQKDSKRTNRIVPMCRLVWVFAGCTHIWRHSFSWLTDKKLRYMSKVGFSRQRAKSLLMAGFSKSSQDEDFITWCGQARHIQTRMVHIHTTLVCVHSVSPSLGHASFMLPYSWESRRYKINIHWTYEDSGRVIRLT